jgi:hypothetical protein
MQPNYLCTKTRNVIARTYDLRSLNKNRYSYLENKIYRRLLNNTFIRFPSYIKHPLMPTTKKKTNDAGTSCDDVDQTQLSQGQKGDYDRAINLEKENYPFAAKKLCDALPRKKPPKPTILSQTTSFLDDIFDVKDKNRQFAKVSKREDAASALLRANRKRSGGDDAVPDNPTISPTMTPSEHDIEPQRHAKSRSSLGVILIATLCILIIWIIVHYFTTSASIHGRRGENMRGRRPMRRMPYNAPSYAYGQQVERSVYPSFIRSAPMTPVVSHIVGVPTMGMQPVAYESVPTI